jgi:hypothetical protein
LEAQIGAECANNTNLKTIASVVMLVAVVVTILAALYITYKDFEEQVMSSQVCVCFCVFVSL